MLVAAGTLIEEKGVDGLSLRECAPRAAWMLVGFEILNGPTGRGEQRVDVLAGLFFGCCHSTNSTTEVAGTTSTIGARR